LLNNATTSEQTAPEVVAFHLHLTVESGTDVGYITHKEEGFLQVNFFLRLEKTVLDSFGF